MDNFDFDINNYSITDIETFLKLKNKYTISDIELSETTIREQLLNSSNINKKHKRDLITFLENAKKILINVKFNNETLKPTTISKNDPLDKTNFPYQKPSLPYLREGDLIHRENLQFIHTKTEDFVPGTLNPLNTRTIIKCLTIDTRFRDNITNTQSSDFIIQLPFKLNKVVSTELISFELPILDMSDTVLEPSTIKYVYLSVEDFNNTMNNVFISAFDKILLDTNILARINMKNENIVSEKKLITEPRKYFGPVDIQRLRIRLFDEYGKIIYMNDKNYSFCLLFKLMYDL